MIVLDGHVLEFDCAEVHPEARCAIGLQRTLRIPDDGGDYPLPPGLGTFPLFHLDDYAARLPETWRQRGGVIAPMHQAEALWINFISSRSRFLSRSRYPFAVKVATGKRCAITGDAWSDHLNRDPQDYVVLPEQPWLDGYCVEEGVVRQFVAMPLGKGYTVEEQLTGAATHGGLQLVAYPMKAERYKALMARTTRRSLSPALCLERRESHSRTDMGLAPGGRIEQRIYDDPYGLDAWDQRHGSRCFISLVNTTQWMAVTGKRPPTEPPKAADYTAKGLPWFSYYGGDAQAVAGSGKLQALASVAAHAKATGDAPLPDNETVPVPHVVELGKENRRPVRESGADGRSG